MSSSGSYNSDNQDSGAFAAPIMNARIFVIAAAIMLLAFFLAASLQYCARWMRLRSGYTSWDWIGWGGLRADSMDAAMTLQADAGLEKRIVDALATFVYSSEKMKTAMECAVCISEFEENETGRLLPRCSHCFHTACIDTWFRTHTTCPLCRLRVDDGDESIARERAENLPSDIEMGVNEASDPRHRCQLREVNVAVEQSMSVPNNISEEQSRSSADASVKEKEKPSMRYPVNTLFYGNQTRFSCRGERFQKVEHLVIDIPSRAAMYPTSSVSGLTPPSSAAAAPSSQESRTPLSHLSAIKRLLSTRERRSASIPATPTGSALDRPGTLTP